LNPSSDGFERLSMVQCLFKTLPDEPGIHEKKIVRRRIPLQSYKLNVKAGVQV
jgi:hypothetical protein